ncbi:MAG: ABC transporter ATP-binding protein [Acidobacteriales bacterium]|nr:ABC transporter ATP-binding protein [Terriglobales bacterium]
MAEHEEEVLGKAYDARLMRRLLGYLRPYQLQVVLALIAIAVQSAADVVGPYLTKTAIDKYLTSTHRKTLLDPWLSGNALTGIAQIGMLYIGAELVVFVAEYIQTYYMQWTGQQVMFDLRSEIFRHLQRLHVAFFDRNPVGRLVTRVTSDVDALNEMFTAGVVSIFNDVFVLVLIIAIMMRMKWWLALIALSVMPLIVYATMVFRKSVRDSYRRIRTAIARINSYLQEHVTGMMVLQLFNREHKAYLKFEEVNRQHMDAYKDAIFAYALYYPVVEILSSTAIALILWFGGLRVLAGSVTIGIVVAFIQYAQRFFRPIQDLSEKYNILQGAMASSERVFKLLDTPAEIVSPTPAKTPSGPGRIELRNVWFAYKELPRDAEAAVDGETMDWVLRDVSFTIEPGETVAIVGHTGAGKTTIISLLLRFYDVQRGAILIDGVDIRELSLTDLRRRFGVVLQDPFLFTGTIAQNIRLGSTWITDEQMHRAAQEVNISDFIASLPQGYATEIHERGSTLSTGQKQLISFARALAHDPRVLILDEATSSVDTETELRVREALLHLVSNRTSIIIAHRLSTIQRADKIIVMHKGKVREIGSHQQLLAQRGIYYKLYQLQYKDQEVLAPAAGDD